MKAMLENSLKYIQTGLITHSLSIKVDTVEGDIAEILRTLDLEENELKIGSYPFFNSELDFGVNVVIKSVDKEKLSKAAKDFKAFLDRNSLSFN